jgi:predicted enzyme related to lactoylglutathione lyase
VSGLNGDPSQVPSHPLAIIIVQDIEAKRNEIISAGGRITRDIFSFPGGRRFHFTDPIGNELGVCSDK